MAALLCILHAAIVGLACLAASCWAENYRCPSACSCLGTMVDCSKRSLREIPADLPHWVTILELQSNEISSVPNGTFQGLTRLEDLDLSYNQLDSTVDWAMLQAAPGITTLKLAYNELTEIPSIGRNGNLTHMVLNHNRITVINPQAIDTLPNLRTLDLNFNRITGLHLDTFPLHASLHQLFLNNNKISVLEAGSLDNLTALEWLKMKKNKLQRLPKDTFSHMRHLKYLDLSANRLRTIEGLSFQGLENLTSLKLRRNSITELMDGSFWGLSAIQHLQLDHNNISRVTRGWLYGLSTLHQLSLSHNQIRELEADAWEDTQLLWELDLSHNMIVALEDETFARLHLLKFMYLNNNRINYIGERAFAGLTALQTLELSGNDISWTVEDMNGAFDGLESLSRLGLDSNRIKSIAKRAFQGLGQLKQLHLVDNDISSIQSNAFSPIAELRELHFNSTNLLCDCQLSWLPQWLTEAGFRDSVNARCGHPDTLKGKSIFEVESDEFMCNDFPKPIILTEPESVVALRGTNVSLRCAAASSSTSDLHIHWKKDNQLLESTVNVENLASTNDGQVTRYTSILHLWAIQNSAEGRYQCIISNDFGSTYSQKARITVHVYPSFSKTPDDVTVRAETTARLECSATGHPAPVIAWQKDGGDDFPAARERRMHVMPSDDVFFIVNVKSFDHGVYSCTATNAAGTIIANATVNVLETPAFVRPMESKVTEVGQTSVLECMASGSPKPKLTWFKDDSPLEVSDRHFFTADNQLLIIVQTRPSDAGHYTCEMSNTLGTERGVAVLKVVQLNPDGTEMGTYDDGSTTTGIIIISVVCCVVGTSLIWVIIIYQTRKKSEEYSSTPTDETTLPGEMSTPYHTDKESSSSPNHLQAGYGNYPDYLVGPPYGHDVPRMFGLAPAPKGRLAAFFPDYDEEDIQASVPLTSEELRPHASDHSIGALHRLPGGSDSDTIHSSSPSTHSTRSTHSTGLLHTFHPQAHGQPSPTPSQPEPAAAIMHALPENGVPPQFSHTLEDRRIPDRHHGSRPPDDPDSGECALSDVGRPTSQPSYTSLNPTHTKESERTSINNNNDWCQPARTSLVCEHPSLACEHPSLEYEHPSLVCGSSAEPTNPRTAELPAASPPHEQSVTASSTKDTVPQPAQNTSPSEPLPSLSPSNHISQASQQDSPARDSRLPVIPHHAPPVTVPSAAPPMVVLPHRTVAPAGV